MAQRASLLVLTNLTGVAYTTNPSVSDFITVLLDAAKEKGTENDVRHHQETKKPKVLPKPNSDFYQTFQMLSESDQATSRSARVHADRCRADYQ